MYGNDLAGHLMRDAIRKATGQDRRVETETVVVEDTQRVQILQQQLREYEKSWDELVAQRDKYLADSHAMRVALRDHEETLGYKVDREHFNEVRRREYDKKMKELKMKR